MNAMEHGNGYDPALAVRDRASRRSDARADSVRITDHGGGREIPQAVTPDLEAKLDGRQSPRGWGLFLIQNMVDEVRQRQRRRTATRWSSIMHLKGGGDGDERDP